MCKLEIAAGSGKIALSFTRELLAIHKSLEIYLNLPRVRQLSGINVSNDSRSSLQAICKGRSRLLIGIISLLDGLTVCLNSASCNRSLHIWIWSSMKLMILWLRVLKTMIRLRSPSSRGSGIPFFLRKILF